MELIILGSGTGVPSLTRGSPAFLVKAENQSILLDGGSGTLVRMLQAGVTYKDVDAILYTHIHPDHVAELVPLIFACKYPGAPTVKLSPEVGGGGTPVPVGLSSAHWFDCPVAQTPLYKVSGQLHMR